MDINRLDGILDNGWNSTKEERVRSALEYLEGVEPAKVLPVLKRLKTKYEDQLLLQVRNITGSGSQQDYIDAYVYAFEACEIVLDAIKKKHDVA
ncbi:hypothetical protein L1F30_15600 [Simiduia sp. 21SJ11W-1]|uniref:hypothetical protein n=1 Tax=Simiduia sp. 21SJ11W-1 TaxID=2909669 RepID=UPI00209CFADF|nr:hypothetical protein [Simiduia sp. 21SJ11W-1]UTA47155.1 hypothetical protein L1F30_13410 [Simiduia sp. 21SJ11W-1]UTA47566.1 hypothetical protein L1F30_15600 [Simiduia sp. 21SJ11W-1]